MQGLFRQRRKRSPAYHLACATGFIALVLVAKVLIGALYFRSVRPDPLASLASYAAEHPSAPIRTFLQDGRTWFEVTGPFEAGLRTFAKGPPAYLFDDTGKLVDWCRDSGNARTYRRRWPRLDTASPTTLDAALRAVSRAPRSLSHEGAEPPAAPNTKPVNHHRLSKAQHVAG